MASDTRALDARSANAAVVVSGADATAATSIKTAVTTLFKNAPIDVTATAVDDASDSVDAVAGFVQRIVVQKTGTGCTANLTSEDTNGDTFDDKFVSVPAATPVCFSVVTKPNAPVAATRTPQTARPLRITVHAPTAARRTSPRERDQPIVASSIDYT